MRYIDALEAAFAVHPEVAEYRINLTERRSLGLGIRDNDVGSAYSPFSFRQTTGGDFLVQWRDQRLSRGKLDSNSLANIEYLLGTARQAAFVDPDAAQFLGPQEVHHVPLFAQDMLTILDTRADYLLDVVTALQAIGQRHGATTLDGGVGGGVGQNWLRTSRGLHLETPGTLFNYSASYDGVIGTELSQPTIPTLPEISAEVERFATYLEQLRVPARPRQTTGTRLAVFHPTVAYSLFSHYIWGNLSGAAVFHGQSPLKIDDFRERRQIFREDLTVAVDPWKPLSPGSFSYTGEGVPSAPISYIERGCLTQPILDLKYARRLGLPPTTPPSSDRIVSIRADNEISWEELQPRLSESVLVLSVLGLHTQDRSSGNYSLATAQAILIADGEAQGRVKATLTGNVFEHLRGPELQLVRFPEHPIPGFALPIAMALEDAA